MKQHKMLDDLLGSNKIALFFVELGKVQSNARSLVLVTNGFLELLVEALIKEKCKSSKRIIDDNRTFPYSSKLIILNEIGAISDKSYRNLDLFRKLRNKAAHEPFFSIKKDSLNNFSIDEYEMADGLYVLCTYLISDIWDENRDVFTPIFAPIATQTNVSEDSDSSNT